MRATGFPYLDEPREAGQVVALAHRGGARHPDLLGLENTLTAFRHATGLGYRYLETDVHATADGHVVAFHDDHLDRVTDREGRVSALPLSEVARARIAGTEPVPLLAHLLEELPGARFNIDLKSSHVVGPMVDLLRRTNAHDRVCVGSFTERTLRRFRREVGQPVATTTGVLAVAVETFAPFAPSVGRLLLDRGAVHQAPHRHRGVLVVDQRFVDRAHAAGRHVHVWTVDDRAEMEHLLDLGVDGLITDRTDVCKEVLVERGQWGAA